MKSYTDIEQSKKLAEILPIESADMKWYFWKSEIDAPKTPTFGYSKIAAETCKNSEVVYLPCWSPAALLEQFEDTAGLAKDYGLWFCYDNRKSFCTKHYDNPVDACVEMILKLKEDNLL